MPYPAMPSRFMPIDSDGSIVGQSVNTTGPVTSYPSGTVVAAWVAATSGTAPGGQSQMLSWGNIETFVFFPETRTCLGLQWAGLYHSPSTFEGSANTTNGADGTWESASFPGGMPSPAIGGTSTAWRANVAALTFIAAKTTVRMSVTGDPTNLTQFAALHIYGVKASGQTPDDIVFLDGDIAFAEYAADKDFGDRPLGTTVVKQFKLKCTSATKTATTILVTCNDTDFAISTDGVTYVTNFTIASLGPGVSSAVLYVRNTTPAPGAALGPRMVRLSAAVGSYV